MTGTRGLGRLVAMVVALVVLLMLVAAEAARAGDYRVAQCGWGIGAELDPSMPRTEGTAAYLRPGYCTAPPEATAPGIWFDDGLAGDGEQGVARARWAAPPGTDFAAVRFDWSGRLTTGLWQVAGIDDGDQFEALAGTTGSTPTTRVEQEVSGPARAFEARLECLLLGPRVGCSRATSSTMTLDDLVLTVADPSPPNALLGGALMAPGWHRGTVAVELGAEDPIGSGVAREEVAIDGATVASASSACALQPVEGEMLATRLRPCPASATRAFEVDTARLGDGFHTLRGCAVDLGGGVGCPADARIAIDNSPPAIDFAPGPEGAVTATASDDFSGPASGAIAVRRADAAGWTDLPTAFAAAGSGTATLSATLPDLSAGTYFFRAVATDAAGNSAGAQLRATGTAAAIGRQVAAAEGSGRGPAPRGGGGVKGTRARATRLSAHLVLGGKEHADRSASRTVLLDRGGRPAGGASPLTVDHGTAVAVRGRLTDAHGRAVARRPVLVIARPSAGSAGPPFRRRARTDAAGRFDQRLAPGTSRRVVVSFHGGGGFGPARARPLSLRVRAAVSLVVSPLRLRTGESVKLSGRVLPGPARIPARGKLVAIQYLERAGRRWRPALVARTDASGRFALHYRFRYIADLAHVRLRATAFPEAGWPYAEGSSPPVTVTVDGR